MRAVNLLPRDPSKGRKSGVDRALAVAMALTVLVVAALGGGFFLEKAHAGTERQRLAEAQAALDQARSQQPSAHAKAPSRLEVPVVLSQEQPWHVALDAALSTRMAWDTLLSQLEYVVPAKVVLTNVTLGSGAGTAGAATSTITLGGSAFSTKDIAVFISQLRGVPNLSNVALVSSVSAPGEKVNTYQIQATVTLPVATVAPAVATDTPTTTTGAQ